MTTNCPYCGLPATFESSRRVYNGRDYGMLWLCSQYPACDAYVGVHKGTRTPLGRMANAELRKAKQAAHASFDPLWRGGNMTRDQAYGKLSQLLRIKKVKCHIGRFDVETCERVCSVLQNAARSGSV